MPESDFQERAGKRAEGRMRLQPRVMDLVDENDLENLRRAGGCWGMKIGNSQASFRLMKTRVDGLAIERDPRDRIQHKVPHSFLN